VQAALPPPIGCSVVVTVPPGEVAAGDPVVVGAVVELELVVLTPPQAANAAATTTRIATEALRRVTIL